MDERSEDWRVPPTTRLRPTSTGRGLPVPPVIPLVATFGLLAGLALGFWLAPKPSPSVAATATDSALPSDSPLTFINEPHGPIQTIDPANPSAGQSGLPVGGLSLAQALVALQETAMQVPPSNVLSARLARYNQVSASPGASDEWVWVFVVQGYSSATGKTIQACTSDALSVGPAAVACWSGTGGGPETTTALVILYYQTGGFLEAQIPAPTDQTPG